MKKIISLSCVFLFLSFTALAQSAEVSKTALEKTEKACKPKSAEACAAKLGISLEEYMERGKTCKKASTASVENTAFPIVKVANKSVEAKTAKKCCTSLEACAKKMGMTVEECKAKCGTKTALKADKPESAIAEAGESQ